HVLVDNLNRLPRKQLGLWAPLTVPKPAVELQLVLVIHCLYLDATGVNWVIFQVRFQDAVEAKGFWGHFDGSSLRPASVAAAPAQPAAPPDPKDPNVTQAPPPPPPPPPPKLSAHELAAAQAQWDKDERLAKSLLTQRIPDSTLIRVHAKKTVRERWAEIVKEFTEKGAYAQTDLRTKFLESRCPDKGNVREFLNCLRVKKEELASVGVIIEERDYTSTIISSLPYALANYASAQLTAARIAQKTLSADFLISILGEEYDRQTLQRNRRREMSKSKDGKDEAMAVSSTSSKWKNERAAEGRPANTEC
ncbi:hypothetical protein CVT26_004101, partial [Gymnopilus dilepis]